VAACLVPVAVWILISGLDDLFITLVGFATCRVRFPWPSAAALKRAEERPIAIFVPLWHEHGVIGRMLRHNLAAIRYGNYRVFAGVYPNDIPTVRAVEHEASLDRRIHIAVCPHDGPTSKGDCLNWIYQRMREYEMLHGMRFQTVVMHDAEDLIDPESLRLINWFSREYAMVQVPVLPLGTRLREWTHGLYCDEFAEYQRKDIPVRQQLGGFLPSNGVGTGFACEALERLAVERGGRPFDPACLTEDYETGFLLHALGYRQVFLPVRIRESAPMATREFFPRRARAAISQRTRWVTGIALQSWERHGWRAPLPQLYWFWRDRKGVLGNLLTPAANALFLYGSSSYMFCCATGRVWHLGSQIPLWLADSCGFTFAIAILQAAVRIRSAGLIYGWRFAAGVPVRMMWGNLVNFAATAMALWEFGSARSRGTGLEWRKTEHIYPAVLATGAVRFQRTLTNPMADASSGAATGESY
jgi:adsorption protein B